MRSPCRIYPPIIRIRALGSGVRVSMMPVWVGDNVFPTITMVAIATDGMKINLGHRVDNTAKAMNPSSSETAVGRNLGSPIGRPIMPTTLITISTIVTDFMFVRNKELFLISCW